ncbi:TPA: hypothetical protein QB352_001425 [Pasteurella multocida]|nr:hypothetical protein [Pasteurella multocida]
MYALDNDSGVQTMPEVKAKKFNHTEPRWFTEGGNGIAPSYPGADWFNIVQAELLGVLKAGGINPDKANLNQLTLAIQQVVQNKVNTAISGKANTQHNHAMSDISGLSNALGAKAPLISPALTGTPTAPTASQSTNNTQIATTAFVKAAIAALVGSAPAALDTLQELANALGQDANFRNTIINQIAGKANTNHTHTVSQITDFKQGVSRQFTQNISENGWTKLPNGLILQWGKVLNPTKKPYVKDITFPLTFPSKCFLIIVTHKLDTNAYHTYAAGYNQITRSNFKLVDGEDRFSDELSYFAIGH